MARAMIFLTIKIIAISLGLVIFATIAMLAIVIGVALVLGAPLPGRDS
jgi:hypothetical protein